jgi:transcriptional regulator with XRE-family HTH domain
MGVTRGPTVGKQRLRSELRRIRDSQQRTQEQVANDMDWSLSKLIRIENSSVAISVSDLRALLAYYGVDDPKQVATLTELARAAKRRMWWDDYRPFLAPNVVTFIGFEADARRIRYFHSGVLPGLLQTRAYTTALLRGMSPELPEEVLEKRIDARMRRQQEKLERDDPVELSVVLDESVLRRRPSDVKTMREQLDRLVELAKRPNVTIHVLLYGAGAHRGWDGPFVILEFPDDSNDDVLYIEGLSSDMVLHDQPKLVHEYSELFDRLAGRALGRDESREFISQIAEETH